MGKSFLTFCSEDDGGKINVIPGGPTRLPRRCDASCNLAHHALGIGHLAHPADNHRQPVVAQQNSEGHERGEGDKHRDRPGARLLTIPLSNDKTELWFQPWRLRDGPHHRSHPPRLMAAQRRSGLFSSFASSSASGTGTSKRLHKQQYHSPLLVEINSIVGAAHGERGCLLKFACLSGKRLSALSGASAAAILLAVATDLMPEGVREPYTAMKNSVMYSDDCSQYTCSKDRSDL